MFPAYLLTDWGFWLFTVLYVVSVVLCVKLYLFFPSRVSPRPNIAAYVPTWIVLLFTYLIIEQFFHQAEHVTQMYQFQFLGMPATQAHGFVWFLDDEWNHFVFNGLYMTGTSIVFARIFRAMREADVPRNGIHIGAMVAFLIMEGWHMVEHTYRIIHHAQGLCDQCAGILDPLTGINRLIIHFWFNFFALVLPAVVYVWFGMPGMLNSLVKRWKLAKRTPKLSPSL